ncbi:nitrogenase-stabilizing/protective protein NifW [Uliginosibacterium paludis]|uniref:Nitrogenase-stabilizing/protective protein NifW n=1 Tax=Uliginosibacterium paludis TaxID=1615952 RepID=A0ABV2CW12_9RHOO
MTPNPDFAEEMEALESAEEFLQYFGIPFSPRVLAVHRLHILQRFHNYLGGAGEAPGFETCKALLARAYADFVKSDARTEAVFRVFQRAQGIAKVSIQSIGRARS